MSCQCNCNQNNSKTNLLTVNLPRQTMMNSDYRQVLWTGDYMQITMMCIPIRSDIGLEIHEETDQILRVEHGYGQVRMGYKKNELNFVQNVRQGDIICIPACTWHNVINIGNRPLRLSSMYAPPHHPAGASQRTKNRDKENKDCCDR